LSTKTPMDNNKKKEITSSDLFGSIPKPLDVNPFEGIDMDDVRVLKEKPVIQEEDDFEELDKINPFEGIDIGAFTVKNDKSQEEMLEEMLIDDINPLDNIDIEEISGPHTNTQHVHTEEQEISEVNPLQEMNMDSIGIEPAQPRQEQEQPIAQPVLHHSFEPKKSTHAQPMAQPSLDPVAQPTMRPSILPIDDLQDQTIVQPQSKPAPKHRPKSKGPMKIAYKFAELHRLREKIVDTLQRENGKSVVITSPHDNAGTTFLSSVLGFNAASLSSMEVILLDLNMRRPELHLPFGVEVEKGFQEGASGSMLWEDTLKDTDLEGLKIMTAGKFDGELALFLNRTVLENMLLKLEEKFDLIIIDTSPVLVQNRNNVDPGLLSMICDMVIMVVQDNITQKSDLVKAVQAINSSGGSVNGIVYNQQFRRLTKLIELFSS